MEKYEVLKFKDGEFELDVNVSPEEDTVWLDEQQLSILFEVDRRTINYHVNKIFETMELDNSVCQKNWRTGTEFRKWANYVLKQFIFKQPQNLLLQHSEYIIDLQNRVTTLENNQAYQNIYGKKLVEIATVAKNAIV